MSDPLIRRLSGFPLAASCCVSIPAAYATGAFGQLTFNTSGETRDITFTANPGNTFR